MIDLFESAVGLQHIQDHLVGFPQETEVGVHILVLALLARVPCLDGLEQDGLGRIHFLQVGHLTKPYILFFLGLVHLLLCGLAENSDDLFQRLDVRSLACRAVLVKTFSCKTHLLKLDTQLQVTLYDFLQGWGPLVLPALVQDRMVQSLQGFVLFAHFEKLLRSLQGILRLDETRHAESTCKSKLNSVSRRRLSAARAMGQAIW
mmetsp:Transcript_66082/g.154714  ORF Transcript_66082/g.154714 Transcript_66082/m.154714 type:complete len:204 (+) Transcript_66082:3147-3758(+)